MQRTARATIARLFAKLHRYSSFLSIRVAYLADNEVAVVAGSQLFLTRRTVRQSAHHSGQAESVNMSPANVLTVSSAPRSGIRSMTSEIRLSSVGVDSLFRVLAEDRT